MLMRWGQVKAQASNLLATSGNQLDTEELRMQELAFGDAIATQSKNEETTCLVFVWSLYPPPRFRRSAVMSARGATSVLMLMKLGRLPCMLQSADRTISSISRPWYLPFVASWKAIEDLDMGMTLNDGVVSWRY